MMNIAQSVLNFVGAMAGLLGALLLVSLLVALWFVGCIHLLSNGAPLKAIFGFVFPPYGLIVGAIQLVNERRHTNSRANAL
jgi:hypothetical protein